MSYKCFGAAVRFDNRDESLEDKDDSDVSDDEFSTTDDESDTDIMEYTGYKCFGAARFHIKQTTLPTGGDIREEYSHSTKIALGEFQSTNGASAESSHEKEYTGYKCFGAAARDSLQSLSESHDSNSNTNNASTCVHQQAKPDHTEVTTLGYKCFGQATPFCNTNNDITYQNLSHLEATGQDRNTSPFLGFGCAIVTASVAGLLLYKYYF